MKIGLVLALVGLGLLGLAALGFSDGRTWLRRWGVEMPPAPAAALNKCLHDGKASYTDGACPQGSRRQPVQGGTLSVLDSPPAAARSAASGLPNARDALLDPQAVDIRQKRMEAVIGQ